MVKASKKPRIGTYLKNSSFYRRTDGYRNRHSGALIKIRGITTPEKLKSLERKEVGKRNPDIETTGFNVYGDDILARGKLDKIRAERKRTIERLRNQ
mgnify:CR=1 FL=1